MAVSGSGATTNTYLGRTILRVGMFMRYPVLVMIVFTLVVLSAAWAEVDDWPMWRRDPQNTGRSPVPGNMDVAPGVIWSYFVGGYANQAVSIDLDGDGQDEVLFVSAGKIVAVSGDGTELWRTGPLGISSIMGTTDFGLDGTIDILAFNSEQSTSYLFSVDGSMAWKYSFPSPASGLGKYGTKIEDIHPGYPGPELVIWPSKTDIGYAFGFPAGSRSGTLIWNATAPETRWYPPAMAVADLDQDGIMEVVVATFERLYSFDGETGESKMYIHSEGINRNYGTLIITEMDDDIYPEVAVLCSNLNEHLWLVDNDGKELREVWDEFFEYSYPEDLIEVKVIVDSVSDFDGDGEVEIVYSIFNQSSDARWHTRVLDALTGEVEMEILDQHLLAAVDLDSDGILEIVTGEQYQRAPSYYTNITSMNLALDAQVELGYMGLIWDSYTPYPPGVNTIANTEMWMEAGDGHAVWVNGSVSLIRLVDGEVKLKEIVPSSFEAPVNVRCIYNGSGVVGSGNDGWLRVIDGKGEVLGRAKTGGYLPSILAADLSGDGLPEVITQNSMGSRIILHGNGSPITEFRAASRRAKYGVDGSLVVWDMDGDGEPEILAGGTGELQVLDAMGNITGSYPLPSNPYDWLPVNLTGDSHWDLFVCSLGGGPHTAHTLAIDGLSGEVLWTKDFGTYAGFMGVMDYDEDGLDDMIVREHFDFYILIGPTGTEKKGPYICGYHTPIILDLDGDGTTEVVWGAGWGSLTVDRKRTIPGYRDRPAYQYMSQIWVQLFGGGDSNEVYAKMPAIGDVDGDGVVEVGAGNLNGTLHCFDGSRGRLEWDYIIGANPSDIISCDIDGDGMDEFIFGTGDGRLISIGEKGVEWSIDFGDRVGTPVICDLDRDSMADILVPVMDGNVYALHIAEPLALLTLLCPVAVIASVRSGTPGRSRSFQRTHK